MDDFLPRSGLAAPVAVEGVCDVAGGDGRGAGVAPASGAEDFGFLLNSPMSFSTREGFYDWSTLLATVPRPGSWEAAMSYNDWELTGDTALAWGEARAQPRPW